MAEDGYNTTWENGDHPDFQGATVYNNQRAPQSQESSSSNPQNKSTSPQPRSSTDSAPRSSSSKWRETQANVPDRQEGLSTIQSESSLVEPGFDENVLRALCDLDCGVPLLLDRIKQSMVSCREASVFFKKRAVIEEEYGKAMQKLARSTAEAYAMSDGKAGSFVNAWHSAMRVHESMAENRLRFALRLNEMSEELATLAKEVEKNRKTTKDISTRYERALQESESSTEKSKNRLDMSTEELERVLLQKEGESFKDNPLQTRSAGTGGKRAIGKAVAKGGLLLKGKNPANIQRQEDDIRARVSAASDVYRKSVIDTQAMRQEYFNFQLPKILRSLKECADEIDLGTQYHLTRYAFLFESIVLSDGSTLVPPDSRDDGVLGLKGSIESIDNRADFRTYMQNYVYARGNLAPRGPRRDGPTDEGFLPPLPSYHGHAGPSSTPNGLNSIQDKGRPTFGVDLADQMARDGVDLPPIVEKCCQAIEKYGLTSQGIYRLSGTTSKVANLRQRLDKDLDSVDLDNPEWSSDINNVASLLKMWLRELPDPLLTFNLHQGFIEASKIDNDRLRHIRLHERVNELPDPNYATLKYFMGHLHRIHQHEAENSMTIQNLGIVFGPTLFGQIPPGVNGQTNGMADTPFQNLAIETILKHYTDIFVDESE